MTAANNVPVAVIGGRPGAIGGARAISDATPIPPREFVADGTSAWPGAPTQARRDATSERGA